MLEVKIAELDGGFGAVCWNSGMAATNGVFMAFLSAGDHCIVSDVAYGGTYRIATQVFTRALLSLHCYH